MPGFEATVHIDRPIEEVFAFLADGENDRKFSPRVLEIAKETDGPIGVGTIYASTVKDAGIKTQRRFELTEFVQPTKIRWKEISENSMTVPDGGYDLAPDDQGTTLRVFNELVGHGIAKLFVGLAARAARKDADGFANRIKAAVEAS